MKPRYFDLWKADKKSVTDGVVAENFTRKKGAITGQLVGLTYKEEMLFNRKEIDVMGKLITKFNDIQERDRIFDTRNKTG